MEEEMVQKIKAMTDEQLKEELMDWEEAKDWHWLNLVRFELFDRWEKRANGQT